MNSRPPLVPALISGVLATLIVITMLVTVQVCSKTSAAPVAASRTAS